MLKRQLSLLVLLAGSLLWQGAAAEEGAWWNGDWGFRKEFLFDMTVAGARADLEDQLVLIRLSTANFAYFGSVNEDGSDLRFVAGDDTTPLSFYVERFDAVNEIALIWVRLPRLAATGTINLAYMYYGNGEAVSNSDPASVFTPDVRLAYDFTSASGVLQDKTAFGTNPVSSGVELTADSLIGGGARLTGPTSQIVLPPSPGLALSSDGYSFSTWVRMDDPSVAEAVLLQQLDAAGIPAVTMGTRGGYLFASIAEAEAPIELQAASEPLEAGQWAHVAMTVGLDESRLLMNGTVVARAGAPTRSYGGQWTVGDPTGAFTGEIDQLMMFAGEQSEGEIAFAARNEAPFGNVTLPGEDNSNEASGGHPNYFATTMRNVTPDGWVVIVILAVMFVIACWVMWIKGALLSRIAKQNNRFMDEYNSLGSDPLALDGGGSSALGQVIDDPMSFKPSTLFPLYHAGAGEVKKRISQRSPAVGSAPAGLTAETIAAVRASIDASMIRQRQKLNNLMVLLTIAISGGPFLGLLGTVVGVMITFAAIAESGDVNVNSIAPGIAAALAATVAGLAVAIPALFGYNYLGQKIKDIDANTQVFADEFITRIAEHYA